MAPFVMPRNLAESVQQVGREAWVAELPATVEDLRDRWALDAVGEPFQPGGRTAWVTPARNRDGDDLVLKVGWRHVEAVHEADGLHFWNGVGAVRLHAADQFGDTVALLVERCRPGTPLTERPEPEQDAVIAGLLRRLWLTPPPEYGFRSLQEMCDTWADEFDDTPTHARRHLDPGLARDGIALLRTLPATAPRTVLLCTDLHAGNVLAAEREPWLAIDPKPHLGDPTYDPLQHLLNCEQRLRADPPELAARMADLLDVERERLLMWLFARCVQESPNSPELASIARRIAPK